ncbi:MAG: TnsA endonuclease N-terminal domain-containing protein [Chloroflexota bacterium]
MPAKPGGAIKGTFPSLKLNRSIRYTSTLERDFLFVLEYEAQVVRYQEQPFEVSGMFDGGLHRYTPDYAVWTAQQQTLVECKPAMLLQDRHTQQQIAVGTQWAMLHGWQFEVVTDRSLREGYQLANLKLLWRYSRLPVSSSQRHEFDEALAQTNPVTLGQLAQTPEQLNCVFYLLFHHELRTDLSRPLDTHSPVWR